MRREAIARLMRREAIARLSNVTPSRRPGFQDTTGWLSGAGVDCRAGRILSRVIPVRGRGVGVGCACAGGHGDPMHRKLVYWTTRITIAREAKPLTGAALMHPAHGFASKSLHAAIPVLAALLICDSVAAATTQQPRIVTLTTASCASCRIVSDSVGYVGHPDDTITVTEISPPARDSRGRFYAMADGARRVAYAFDPRGRLLQQFGTAGQGPGEFSSLVTEIRAGRGDTLFFFERNKVHVFSPDYGYSRTVTTAIPGFQGRGTAVLANGTLVLPTAQSQFTLLDPTGQRIGAGPVTLEGVDATPCLSCRPRHFSAGVQPGTVWSSAENAYVVEQHDMTGKLLARFTRQVSWFFRWSDSQGGGHGDIRAELSKSRFAGVTQGSDG
jgi:hypothetical protein